MDTLDTLALLGRLEEFETAVRLVLEQTFFDTDVVVSVFETNIRMLGYVVHSMPLHPWSCIRYIRVD